MMSEVTSVQQFQVGDRVRVQSGALRVSTGRVSNVSDGRVIVHLDKSYRNAVGDIVYIGSYQMSDVEAGCCGVKSTGKYTPSERCTESVKEQGLCGKHLGIKKRKATMDAKRTADVERIIASWKDSIKQANALKSYGVECSAHVNGEVILSAAGTQLFIDMLFNATAGA